MCGRMATHATPAPRRCGGVGHVRWRGQIISMMLRIALGRVRVKKGANSLFGASKLKQPPDLVRMAQNKIVIGALCIRLVPQQSPSPVSNYTNWMHRVSLRAADLMMRRASLMTRLGGATMTKCMGGVPHVVLRWRHNMTVVHLRKPRDVAAMVARLPTHAKPHARDTPVASLERLWHQRHHQHGGGLETNLLSMPRVPVIM